MIVIKLLRDVRRSGRLDADTAEWLEEMFRSIAGAYTEEDHLDRFSLEDVGPIAFLESPEDCHDLSLVGLPGPYRGISPEWVELKQLTGTSGKKLEMYVATIVRNNSEVLTLCSVKGTLDEGTESFLLDNAC